MKENSLIVLNLHDLNFRMTCLVPFFFDYSLIIKMSQTQSSDLLSSAVESTAISAPSSNLEVPSSSSNLPDWMISANPNPNIITTCTVVPLEEPPFRVKNKSIYFRNVEEALRAEKHGIEIEFIPQKKYYKAIAKFAGEKYTNVFVPLMYLLLRPVEPSGEKITESYVLEIHPNQPESNVEYSMWEKWLEKLRNSLFIKDNETLLENGTNIITTSTVILPYKPPGKPPLDFQAHLAKPGNLVLQLAFGYVNRVQNECYVGIRLQLAGYKDLGVRTFSNAARHRNLIEKKRKAAEAEWTTKETQKQDLCSRPRTDAKDTQTESSAIFPETS